MLSILIPVYNFDVTQFVNDLHRLSMQEKIAFEIIVLDDASDRQFKQQNRQLEQLAYVSYSELPENIGRAAIRNRLAQQATHDYLLFTDCDSKINDDKFIHRYIKNISPYSLLYGGRNYSSQPPENTDYYLRWIYGVKRETIPAERRKERPWDSFMTNNFLIPRKLFLETGFNEQLISGYGHEDTLFGLELKKKNISIIHLNNPLQHIGLESVNEFLSKTENGIRNLYTLYQHDKIDRSVKLIRLFEKLQQTKATPFIANYFIKNKAKITDRLHKRKNTLKWFDVYKTGYLCALHHRLER